MNSNGNLSQRIVLITGGIGSGKSVVSRILRLNGFFVYDTDAEARIMINNSEYIRQQVVERWGSAAYIADGTLNTKLVSDIIFNNTAQRMWFNSLIHSRVVQQMNVSVRRPDMKIAFVECAIPRTSGIFQHVDETWLVIAPEQLRVERVISRSNLLPPQIMKRIQSQNQEYQNIPTPLNYILNDNTFPLLPQIETLLNKLL